MKLIQSVPDDLVWDLWIDAAYTEKTINDPTGIDLIAKWGNNIVVKQSWDVWKKLPDLLKFIVELEREGLFDKSRGRIFIEPKASGNSLADYIEHETDYNFVRIGEHAVQERKLVQGGHYARHEVIKPKAESHTGSNCSKEIGTTALSHRFVDSHARHMTNTWTRSAMRTTITSLPKIHSSMLGPLTRSRRKSWTRCPIFLTGQYSIREQGVKHEVNERGDIELFDFPIEGFSYRYVCCMVLRTESERPGSTAIVVVDRITKSTMAIFRSKFITHEKAAVKAIEMASYYSEAKIDNRGTRRHRYAKRGRRLFPYRYQGSTRTEVQEHLHTAQGKRDKEATRTGIRLRGQSLIATGDILQFKGIGRIKQIARHPGADP